MFTHLHGHSTFSFLEAIGKIPQIINKVKELEMNAIAITDYAGLFGAIKFFQIAKAEGINPIIGIEVGFVLDINSINNQIGNICLLAKDFDGYQNLIKLVSFANTIGITGKPKIDLTQLQANNVGLIAIMGGKESWIGQLISNDEKDTKISEILSLIGAAIGAENVFLEITSQSYSNIPELKKINDKILELAKSNNIKVVVNNNFHYVSKGDKLAWETALCIKDGMKMYEENRRKPKGDFHIMTEEEIKYICSKNGYTEEEIQGWIDTNNMVADSIDIKITLGQTLFPEYVPPEDILELYKQHENELIEKV